MFKLPTAEYEVQSSTVYEPSEDSFLLLDALEEELQLLVDLKPMFAIEIGSGSGVNIASLSSVLRETFCFATDINPDACLNTLNTSKRNNQQIEICRMDLFSCFKQNIFDVVLFNPPYVVTEDEEIVGVGIERSWAGGNSGRVIIDRFLNALPNMMSKTGICYMVIIEENKPKEIETFVKMLGFSFEIIKSRKVRGEHLFIVKMIR